MDSKKYWALGISDQLMTVIGDALEHCLVAVQGGDSFIPILVGKAQAEPTTYMLLATTSAEEAIATGRLVVANGTNDLYALAYDGFVDAASLSIPRSSAINIEAYDRRAARGVRLALRYRLAASARSASPIGNLIFVDELQVPTLAGYGPIVKRYESLRAEQ